MIVDDEQGRLAEKDAYIAEHLMDLQPDTLRFLVADLVFHNRKLTALCDGYRGEVEAAQWSTNVLAKEVKRLQSALTRARADALEDASRIMKVRAANAMRRYHDGLRGEVPASVIMALPLVTEQDAAAIRAKVSDAP